MTAKERIEAAIAARSQATPGPWDVFEDNEIVVADGTILAELWLRKNWDTESNATLIAAAPDLATEVIRLRKWQSEAVGMLKADRAVGLLKKHRLSLQSIWSPEGYSEIALEWLERLRAAIEGRP